MSSAQVMNKTEAISEAEPVDMKLEAVLIDVSDVDRAKAFYEKLGWRLDVDFALGDFRGVQMTPHNSPTSILFGKGGTGAGNSRLLVVSDIAAARDELIARGIEVSEVFHFAAGPFNDTVENPRVAGPDPEGRPYFSFVSFQDPDGNNWLVQQVSMRAPGREWKSAPKPEDVTVLADLLHETSERHGNFESTHVEHHWWDWYAPYLSARQAGSSPEEAADAADRRMEQELKVLPL